jgi:glycosyltransferase involved in cell wall biosynthesis
MVVEHEIFRTERELGCRTDEGRKPRGPFVGIELTAVPQPSKHLLEAQRCSPGGVSRNEAREQLVDRHGGCLPQPSTGSAGGCYGAPVTLAIAIDATLWDERTTGIGLYAKHLVRAMEAQGVQVRRVGARSSGENPRGAMGRTRFFLAELPGVLERCPEPLFHGVSNFNLPLMRVPGKKLVLTVHDLVPELLPETVSTAFRWQFRLWLQRSLRVADQVICISEKTRDDLLRWLPELNPEKTHVVHLGVDHVARVPAPDSVGERYIDALGLPSSYILYAGSLDVRKNVRLLLDALEPLRARQNRSPTVVLVGQSWFGSGPLEKRIGQMRADGWDLRPLGYQEDPVFYEIIRRASVFVFPSLYEGFGLPPLEAMRLGVPTIVSDGGALPEICAAGARVIPTNSPEVLAQALDELLRDPAARTALGAKGLAHARTFTWEEAARQTLRVYERALRG